MRFSTVTIGLCLALVACKSDADKAKDLEAAMIAQAQKDADAETELKNDSIAIAQTFVLDTIVFKDIKGVQVKVEDDEGAERDSTVTTHVFKNTKGWYCNAVDEAFWRSKAVGDTLTCQWAATVEP